jgi:hypothetical protein
LDWVKEYKGVNAHKTKDELMPNWGQPKGMNTKTKDEGAKKRRKEDEPDGMVGSAVKYLKMSVLPTNERIKAEDAYEREQEEKKRKSGKK